MIFSDELKALLFGFIQGICEFLPISSSGHLVLLGSIFNSVNLLFILILHLGTLAAIFTYYKKELLQILNNFLSNPFQISGSSRLVYLIICATVPSVLGAFFLMPLVKKSLLQTYWTGAGFILTALCLLLTLYILKKPATKKYVFHDIKQGKVFPFFSAGLIGLAQVLAFFPGISRSGLTVCAALFLGLSQKQAVLFSFLLAIPAILGAIIFELSNTSLQEIPSFYILSIAFFSAWFFGYLALKLLIRSLQSLFFPFFSFYLLPLGIFIIIKSIL